MATSCAGTLNTVSPPLFMLTRYFAPFSQYGSLATLREARLLRFADDGGGNGNGSGSSTDNGDNSGAGDDGKGGKGDDNKDGKGDHSKNGGKDGKADDDKVPATWDEIFKHPRFQQLNKKATNAETELEKRRKADEKAERDKKASEGKLQEVIDELTPKAERAEKLERVVTTFLESAMAEIPEDKRTLIPDGLSPEDKLEYIAKNRALLIGEKKSTNKSTNPPGNDGNGGVEFTTSQIRDPKFYRENREAINKARAEGRIKDA